MNTKGAFSKHGNYKKDFQITFSTPIVLKEL